MSTPREVICAACQTAVMFKSDFKASHKCPKAHLPSGRTCPTCGKPTVWRAGRYSTFHGCQDFPKCNGKIGAPRGASATAQGEGDTTEDAPTPAPVPETPASTSLYKPNFKVGDALLCVEGNSALKTGETYFVTSADGVYRSGYVKVEGQEEWFASSRFQAHTDPTPIPEAPKATPAAPPMASSTGADPLAGALLGALGPALKSMIDAAAQNAAQEAVAKSGAGKLTIQWVDPTTNAVVVQVEGGHKAVAEVIDLIKCGFTNIMLVGPAGSGKTTIAADVAKALGRKFAHLSCTSGMSESKIVGRVIPNLQTGQSVYSPTSFTSIYENGGVFLFDETDAADPNVLLTINSAIANGHMEVENPSQPNLTRHAETIIIAAANTYGNGADRQYVGRNQLDAAFMDRFVGAIVTVDYDQDLEKAILPDAAMLADLWNIRRKVGELKIRRVVGTRAVVAVAKHMKGGKSRKDAIRAVFSISAGWTADELSRAGIAA